MEERMPCKFCILKAPHVHSGLVSKGLAQSAIYNSNPLHRWLPLVGCNRGGNQAHGVGLVPDAVDNIVDRKESEHILLCPMHRQAAHLQCRCSCPCKSQLCPCRRCRAASGGQHRQRRVGVGGRAASARPHWRRRCTTKGGAAAGCPALVRVPRPMEGRLRRQHWPSRCVQGRCHIEAGQARNLRGVVLRPRGPRPSRPGHPIRLLRLLVANNARALALRALQESEDRQLLPLALLRGGGTAVHTLFSATRSRRR
mmetsp:Transcript_23225/g.50826  ORF Transcript_23225/g.50826 Transcript_23225/m.50826 type:complete len:255 (-) Transcript_23225:494-1258(-)